MLFATVAAPISIPTDCTRTPFAPHPQQHVLFSADTLIWDIPGGAMVKNLLASAGDARDVSEIPR